MKMSEFQSGIRVSIQHESGRKTGTVGRMWGDGTCDLIVRFDSGEMVEITEDMAELFEPELLN